MRRFRITPATGVAFLALLLALSGGAYALSSSTAGSTIAACAHKHGGGLYVAKHCSKGDRKLSWNATGPTGPKGAAGAQGPAGAPGGPGSFALTLASGKSLSGAYGFSGSATAGGQLVGDTQSFIVPLASAPSANDILIGGKPTANCPGSAAAPTAAPGQLCIYEAHRVNVELPGWEDPITGESGGKVPSFGFEMSSLTKAAGHYEDFGSWAVTAP